MQEALLALSRVNRKNDAFQRCDSKEIVDTLVERHFQNIESSDISIRVSELPECWGDKKQIEAVFTQLIQNAIAFRKKDAPCEIEISAAEREHDILFEVRDNGIGIDPAYHQDVFGLFRRLHGSEEYQTTGAGLSLCKKIVERHGGTISIKPDTKGDEGTTVVFSLPKSV